MIFSGCKYSLDSTRQPVPSLSELSGDFFCLFSFCSFGTEVMVTVATKLDGPIKILFPRSLVPDPKTGKIALSLLGLGDIVIPGFFLALLLRFDASRV